MKNEVVSLFKIAIEKGFEGIITLGKKNNFVVRISSNEWDLGVTLNCEEIFRDFNIRTVKIVERTGGYNRVKLVWNLTSDGTFIGIKFGKSGTKEVAGKKMVNDFNDYFVNVLRAGKYSIVLKLGEIEIIV